MLAAKLLEEEILCRGKQKTTNIETCAKNRKFPRVTRPPPKCTLCSEKAWLRDFVIKHLS